MAKSNAKLDILVLEITNGEVDEEVVKIRAHSGLDVR